jgi:hypothetical protein
MLQARLAPAYRDSCQSIFSGLSLMIICYSLSKKGIVVLYSRSALSVVAPMLLHALLSECDAQLRARSEILCLALENFSQNTADSVKVQSC